MSDSAQDSKRGSFLRAWWPALAYMALIWTLSSMQLTVSLNSIPFKDKGVHAVEYGALALLLAHAIRRTWLTTPLWRVLLYAVALTFVWGFLDEVHQAFVPGRNADARDLLADTVGAFLGSACLVAFHWLRSSAGTRRTSPP